MSYEMAMRDAHEDGREEGREEGSITSFVTAVKGIMEMLHIELDKALLVAKVPPQYISAVKARI